MNRKIKCVKWSEGWNRIEEVTKRKGWLVEIGHNPNVFRPYCVHYAGSGYYFNTLHEARAYCYGRGWLPNTDCIYEELSQA